MRWQCFVAVRSTKPFSPDRLPISSIALGFACKLRNDGLLIDQWSPDILRMELNNYIWGKEKGWDGWKYDFKITVNTVFAKGTAMLEWAEDKGDTPTMQSDIEAAASNGGRADAASLNEQLHSILNGKMDQGSEARIPAPTEGNRQGTDRVF